MKLYLSIALLIVSLFSTGCGGGASTPKTTPPPAKYSIGGTVSGLAGTGLVLQNNSGDNLAVSATATAFTFPTTVASGSPYKVSVMTQPSGPIQNCVVSNDTGTANGNVTTVSVACTTTTYTVGGSISGLVGTGLELQNNSGDTLPVSPGATGFTFTAGVNAGTGYKVSVVAQPTGPAQTCAVTGGVGTANANVTGVVVACTTNSTTYTVGGTILGLLGKDLVLQNNSGDDLIINANQTSFTFVTAVANGAGYGVSILREPSNPTQNCAVSGGIGTSSVNVTTVLITCSNINEWTWVHGPDVDDQPGTYGISGIPDTNNVPGARYWGTSWADANGNFWLFGGYGYDSVRTVADLNDVWKGNYDTTGQWTWTWVGGAEVAGVGGTYGTLGTADPANMPGARDSAVSWADASGNFWVFGGHGYDSARTADNLNDLWKYSAGEWTWVSGSKLVNQKGTYGTKGVADPSNVPGARYSAVSWTDKQGNFWLFGGSGYDSTGTIGYLNDLWKGSYNSTGQWTWTWVGGSNVAGIKGTYGSEGVSAAANVPGARYLSASWTDAQGNLWLFGGFGPDSANNTATLSDLWEYNLSSGEWTWMSGPETAGESGIYGTLGTADITNIPGSRQGSVGWTDAAGNFWVFGGVGFDSSGVAGELNDLWEYSPSGGMWTWQSGSNLVGEAGNYGTLGILAPGNVPGARGGSPNWIDADGNLWLFGGNGPISGVNGSFSDLWKFVP